MNGLNKNESCNPRASETPTTLTLLWSISVTIYSGNNYRKIYEQHFGPIPFDQEGRRYEIHHIDGNRNNNRLTNLQCVSMKEHYEIHYDQADWSACTRIAAKMHLSTAEIGVSTTLHNLQMTKDGTHPWLGSEFALERNRRLVAAGTHNFIGGKIQSVSGRNRVAKGTHPFQKRPDGTSYMSELARSGKCPLQKRPDGTSVASDTVKNGTHPTQKKWKCECCGVSGKGGSNFSRWHKNGKCSLK